MVASFFTNPFVLTIVVGAAIGLAIYQYFEEEKRRRASYRYGSGRGPPDSPPPDSPNNGGNTRNLNPSPILRNRKPVHSKSGRKIIDSTPREENGNAIPIESSNSQRIQSFYSDKQVGASTSKKQQVRNTIAPTSTKQQVLDNKTVNSDTIRNSVYDEKNYEKDVCDKIRNDVNQNFHDENKTFPKKVDNSTLLENNIETKELNINFVDCSSSSSVEKNQMVDPKSNSKHLFHNVCEKEPNTAINLSEKYDENELEKGSSKLVFVYEKQVLDKIKSDVKSITEGHSIEEDDNNAACETITEVQEFKTKVLNLEACTEKEQNSEPFAEKGLMNISGNQPQSLCCGCKEEPANAVNEPCQHRCFCMECAVKIFKIYEYCTVCRSEIVSFHNA